MSMPAVSGVPAAMTSLLLIERCFNRTLVFERRSSRNQVSGGKCHYKNVFSFSYFSLVPKAVFLGGRVGWGCGGST